MQAVKPPSGAFAGSTACLCQQQCSFYATVEPLAHGGQHRAGGIAYQHRAWPDDGAAFGCRSCCTGLCILRP